MREKQFVEQNQDKWKRFETFTEGNSKPGPDEFGELFASITDDLSYARTYYPKRSIRLYLNNLAQKTYLNLHKQRSQKRKAFAYFWMHELPLALYQARKELNISLLFFILSMCIGVVSSVHDPDFPNVILGSDYVSMTEENIRKGEPMGVYKTSDEIDMFLAITLNNLLVAFRTFVLGAFFGVGTLIIMMYNGIMVGTFQYFFVERDLFTESFLTIWMHGALEISAIVIAGAAGLTMGRGLLFPGTLPRMQSFQIGARRALKIMLGLVPIFITAAFIEGFFTRLTEVHDALRAAFIFGCFGFVGLYFWWLPSQRFRGNPEFDALHRELIAPIGTQVLLPLIRKSKEIFTTSFVLFRINFGKNLLFALAATTVYTLTFWWVYGSDGTNDISFTRLATFNLRQFHAYDTFYWNFFMNIALLSGVCWNALKHMRSSNEDKDTVFKGPPWRMLIKILVIVTLFELFILSGNGIVATLGMVFIPFLLLWMVISVKEQLNLREAFARMITLLNGTRRYPFLTFLSLGLLSIMMLFLIDSPFTWFYMDVLQWNFDTEEDTRIQLVLLSLLFMNQLGLSIVLPLHLYGQVLEYYSARESRDAEQLRTEVSQIGKRRRAYGLESE